MNNPDKWTFDIGYDYIQANTALSLGRVRCIEQHSHARRKAEKHESHSICDVRAGADRRSCVRTGNTHRRPGLDPGVGSRGGQHHGRNHTAKRANPNRSAADSAAESHAAPEPDAARGRAADVVF